MKLFLQNSITFFTLYIEIHKSLFNTLFIMSKYKMCIKLKTPLGFNLLSENDDVTHLSDDITHYNDNITHYDDDITLW